MYDILCNAIIFLWARLQQFLCNLVKAVFIIHFRLFPHKRFRLPSQAPPLWPRRRHGAVAGILWQTNYTPDVTLSLYVNYWWNRLMAPDYSYRFFDDNACADYVRTRFPGEEWEVYQRLQVGAAKADYWRVLALLAEGGVYLDLDASLCWYPGHFLRQGQREILLRMPDKRLTNYCFAAAAGHSLLEEINIRIKKNITENTLNNVFDMTGPTVFQQIGDREHYNIVSSRLVSRQGQLTNKSLQYPHRPDKFWINQQKEIAIVK